MSTEGAATMTNTNPINLDDLRAELTATRETSPPTAWADGVACGHGTVKRECEWCSPVDPAARPVVIEYGIAELHDPESFDATPLPHCGSWYTDRYYANDLMGEAAALAAAQRVTEQCGGTYVVYAIRSFRRLTK